MTLNDLESPKYEILVIFTTFDCSPHLKSEVRRNGWPCRSLQHIEVGTYSEEEYGQ